MGLPTRMCATLPQLLRATSASKPLTNIAPVLLGKCGGSLSTGNNIGFDAAPLGNLYITLLHAFGVDATTFGMDGTDTLSGLLA